MLAMEEGMMPLNTLTEHSLWYGMILIILTLCLWRVTRSVHYIIVTNGGKTIIGCSELGMLGWLSHKHDLELDEKSQFNSPYYLEEG